MANKVKVTREEMVELFAELGFSTAKKWSTDRMEKKAARILEQVDEDTEITNKVAQKALERIQEAGEGAKIVITAPEEAEAPKAVKKTDAPAKKEKAPAEKKAAKKPAAKSEPTVRKTTRIERATLIMKDLKKKITVEDLVEMCDAEFATNGGKSNLKESLFQVKVLLKVLPLLNVITVDGDNVIPVK